VSTLFLQRRYDECLRACTAVVLGLDYDDTPEVSAADTGTEDFWDAWVGWANRSGHGPMLFYYDAPPVERERWIAVVPSLNTPGKDHAVVMRRTALVLDPVSNGERYSAISPSHVKYGITFTQPNQPKGEPEVTR
jgi:hypothetical protein